MAKRINRDMLAGAVQKGMSDAEIANFLECSISAVERIRKEMGLRCNRKRNGKAFPLYGPDTCEDISMCLNCKRGRCNGNLVECKKMRKRNTDG